MKYVFYCEEINAVSGFLKENRPTAAFPVGTEVNIEVPWVFENQRVPGLIVAKVTKLVYQDSKKEEPELVMCIKGDFIPDIS